jgi:hypothetical protein
MRNVFYELYREEILALANSMVIKCDAIAQTLNRELTLQGHAIEDDPIHWKYYLNLSGDYHPTDTKMTVISVDTLEEIIFNKTNLQIHRATFREYRLGEPLYEQLVRRYPHQVDLIRGILNPVDIQKAIAARDGDILTYEPTLIEPNEESLLGSLQRWVRQFFLRWYNVQYVLTDDLYIPAFWGLLYLHLPNAIQQARLRSTRSDEAHSFHVREYLASNGGLDRYLPYLNTRQRMWLYKNLRYLQRHVGQQRIFDSVVKHIILDRRFPLQAYRIEQDTSPQPDAIYPDVDMMKVPLGNTFIEPDNMTSSVYTILSRQATIARDNSRVIHDAEVETTRLASHGQFSQLPTKVVESEVVDRSTSSVRSLEHVKINHWLYLATHQRYNTFISITHPGSGEIMSVTVREAFVIALYCFYRMQDIPIMDSVPRVIAYDVLRTPLPTYHELSSIVDVDALQPGLIQAIMDRVTPIGQWQTVDEFHEGCIRLHQEYLALWELHAFQTRMLQEGYTQQLVKRHFMHIKCSLTEEVVSFEQWFTERGYGIEHLSNIELEQLFIDVVAAATGSDLSNTQSLAEIHRALISLTNQLTSYTTQFISTINDDSYWYLAWKRPRIGDIRQSTYGYSEVPIKSLTVLRLKGQSAQQINIQESHVSDVRVSAQTAARVCLPTRLQYRLQRQDFGTARVSLRSVGLRGFSFEILGDPPESNDLGFYHPPED